jgi:hypothetical protein
MCLSHLFKSELCSDVPEHVQKDALTLLLQRGRIGESEVLSGQADHPINVDEGSLSKKLKGTGLVAVKRSISMDTFADRAMTSTEVDKANIHLPWFVYLFKQPFMRYLTIFSYLIHSNSPFSTP